MHNLKVLKKILNKTKHPLPFSLWVEKEEGDPHVNEAGMPVFSFRVLLIKNCLDIDHNAFYRLSTVCFQAHVGLFYR